MARFSFARPGQGGKSGAGVNINTSPVSLPDGEWTKLQNAEFSDDEADGGLRKRGGLAALNAVELDGVVLAAIAVPLRSEIDSLVAAPGLIFPTASGFVTTTDGTVFTPLAVSFPPVPPEDYPWAQTMVSIDDLLYYVGMNGSEFALYSLNPQTGDNELLLTLDAGETPSAGLLVLGDKVYMGVETNAPLRPWTGPSVPYTPPTTPATGRIIEWDPNLGSSRTIGEQFGTGGGELDPSTQDMGAAPTALLLSPTTGELLVPAAAWVDTSGLGYSVRDYASGGGPDVPGEFFGGNVWSLTIEPIAGTNWDIDAVIYAIISGVAYYEQTAGAGYDEYTYIGQQIVTVDGLEAFGGFLIATMQRAGTNPDAPLGVGPVGLFYSSGDRPVLGYFYAGETYAFPVAAPSEDALLVSPDANPGAAWFTGFINFDSSAFVAYGDATTAVGGAPVNGKIYRLDSLTDAWVEDKDVISDYGGDVYPGKPFELDGDLYWPWFGIPGTTNEGFVLKRTTGAVWTQAATGLDLVGGGMSVPLT